MNEMKENERYLKRIIKDKISFHTGLLVAFMISGFAGISSSLSSAPITHTVNIVRTEQENGATGSDMVVKPNGKDVIKSAIILAPVKGEKGEVFYKYEYATEDRELQDIPSDKSLKATEDFYKDENEKKEAMYQKGDKWYIRAGHIYVTKHESRNKLENIFVIGQDTETNKTFGSENSIAVGRGVQTSGSQAVTLGNNTFAVGQATSVGNDVYALGASSIAIGTDDPSTFAEFDKYVKENPDASEAEIQKKKEELYLDATSVSDRDKYYKKLYDMDFGTGKLKGRYGQDNAIYSPTATFGRSSIAMGTRALAYGDGSLAIGTLASALKNDSMAVGIRTRAEGVNSMAIGNRSSTWADNTIATGSETQVLNVGGTAYGYKAYSGGEGSIAIGTDVYANTEMDFDSKYHGISSKDNEQKDKESGYLIYDLNGVAKSAPSNEPLSSGEFQGKNKKFFDQLEKYLEGIEEVKDGQIIKHKPISPKTEIKNGVKGVVQKHGKNAIVIGNKSVSYGDNSIALGRYATAKGDNSFSLGSYSYAYANNTMSIGLASSALAENSIAMGIGTATAKTAKNSVAFGTGSVVYGKDSASVGSNTRIWGNDSNSFGEGNDISGNNILALGNKILVDGTGEKGSNIFAIGNETHVLGKITDSMAIGKGSRIGKADKSSVIENAVAIGNKAIVENTTEELHTGKNSMAIGNESYASLENSMALGYKSKTDYSKADLNANAWVAKGAFSVPTSAKVGVISVGSQGQERRIVNVAPGAKDTDAVNVSQLRTLEEMMDMKLEQSGNRGGIHYTAYNRGTGSESEKVENIINKENDYKSYVSLKSQLLQLEARKKLNGETFDEREGSSYKKLKAEVERLEGLPSNLKDTATSLKQMETELSSTTDHDKFTEIIGKIAKAKGEDAGKTILTGEETKIRKESNYDNDGATGKDSMALGFKAKASVDNGIAIGALSNANVDKGQIGYDITTQDGVSKQQDSTWKATHAAVSVGDGTTVTRQITSVAAGTSDTDAVNVAQLKQVKTYVDGKTIQLKDSANNTKEKTLGTSPLEIKIAGEQGIKTTLAEDGTMNVTLTDDVNEKLTKLGTGSIDDSATNKYTVTGETVKNYITQNIEDKLNNYSAQLKFSDGTNEKTLDLKTKTFKVTGDTNIDTAATEDGIQVKLKENVTVTKVASDSFEVKNSGPVLSASGLDMKEKKISNVENGTADKDAVNYSQLKTKVDQSAYDTKIQEITNNINNKMDSSTADGKYVSKENILTLSAKDNTNKVIKYGDPSSSFKITGDSNVETKIEGDTLTVSLAKNPTLEGATIAGVNFTKKTGEKVAEIHANGAKITNIADGEVKEGSRAAVNGGQLFTVQKTAEEAKTAADTAQTTANEANTKATKVETELEKQKPIIADNKAKVAEHTTTLATHTTAIADNKANIEKGMMFGADNKASFKRDLGETVTISGDSKNIATETDAANGKIKISISETPSFGSVKINDNGKITGVKKGTTDQDVVNYSQLKPLADAINATVGTDGTVTKPTYTVGGNNYNTVNDALNAIHSSVPTSPITFKDGGSGSSSVALGSTVTLKEETADKNINVSLDSTSSTYKFSIKENPEFKGVVKALSGFDANNQKITNVAAATGDNDAVNYKQLKDLKAGLTSTVSLTLNSPVAYTATVGGEKTLIKKVVTGGETKYYKASDFEADGTLKTGATALKPEEENTIKVSAISKDGSVTTPTTITNIAKGKVSADSEDAINGAQLKSVLDAMGMSSKPDGSINAPVYHIAGNTYNSITEVANAISKGDLSHVVVTDADGNKLVKIEGKYYKTEDVEQNEKKELKPKAGATEVTDGIRLSAVNPTGDTKKETVLGNIAAGSKDTDAVNVSQLKKLGLDPTAKDEDVKPVVTYDSKDKTAVTLGATGKPVTIKNVADGKDANDAVNFSQLETVKTTANAGKDLAEKGWNVAVNDDAGKKVSLGDTVRFKSKDSNLTLTETEDTVNKTHTVALEIAKSPKFGEVAVNAENKGTIKGLKNTTWNGTVVSGQAATEDQLKGLQDSINTTISKNDGNAVKYDADTKEKVTLAGGSNGTTITNLKAGNISAGSKDAINGAQLHSILMGSTASEEGKPFKVKLTSNNGFPHEYTDIKSAFESLAGGFRIVGSQKNGIDGIAGATNVHPNQTMAIVGADDNITTSVAKNTKTLTYKKKDGTEGTATLDIPTLTIAVSKTPKFETVTATKGISAGEGTTIVNINKDGKGHITGLKNTSFDKENIQNDRAATEGQLSSVVDDLDAKDKLNVKYDSATKDTVTLGGTTPVVLKNIKAGTDDKDAVNVGQLNQKIQEATSTMTNTGMKYSGNTGTGSIHLGDTFNIKGGATETTQTEIDAKYDAKNIATVYDETTKTLNIKMSKTPTFESAKVTADIQDDAAEDTVVNKKYVDGQLKNMVGSKADGKDGKAGEEGSAGNKGLTGKDGLNGKDLSTKVNALRNGEAGTVVYTNETGERLVKANNGNYYKASQVKENGELQDGVNENDKANPVKLTLVNPDGSTKGLDKAMVLGNIANGVADNDAVNVSQLNDVKKNLGLLDESGKPISVEIHKLKDEKGTEVTKAPKTLLNGLNDTIDTVNKGMRFGANVGGEYSQYLGSTVAILAKGKTSGTITGTEKASYKGDNLLTEYEYDETTGKGTISVGMKENPKFKEVVITKADGTNPAITLKSDNDGSSSITFDGKKGKIIGLEDLKDGADGSSAVNKNYVDQKLKAANNLTGNGADGKDGKVGETGAGGTGLTGADGLNGKDLTTKVNALRNGEAGNLVYTDEEGNRLFKANDGKYYKEVDKDGNSTGSAVENPILSLVNPKDVGEKGKVKTAVVLNNVASGLGLRNQDIPISQEDAQKAIQKLHEKSGRNLQKGVNLQDLQALAVAGLDFVGNIKTNKVHQNLGTTVVLKGEEKSGQDNTTFNSAAGNILVDKTKDNKALEVKLSSNLQEMESFTTKEKDGKKSVLNADGLKTTAKDGKEANYTAEGMTVKGQKGETKVGETGLSVKGKDGKDAVTLGTDSTGSNPALTFAKDGEKGTGVITGLKDLDDTSDATSAVNKKYVDNKLQGATTIIGNGKDGKDGKDATDSKSAAAQGATKEDGLNGKDLTSKVNALRNGEAGTVVYTNEAGERLVKANNGNYYKASQVKENGELQDGIDPEKAKAKEVRLSLVNPDGSTKGPKKAMVLGNIANGVADNDAVNMKQFKEALGNSKFDIISDDNKKEELKVGTDNFAIKGGDNITTTVSKTGNIAEVKVSLKKDIAVDSIKVGEKVNISKEGINAGNTTISNVKAGVAKNDAVNMGQLEKVADRVNQNSAQVLENAKQIAKTKDELRNSGALGAAMAALNPMEYDPMRKNQVMAGVGSYKNAQAVAVGVSHHFNENVRMQAGVSVSEGRRTESMVNLGLTWKLGNDDRSSEYNQYKDGPISSMYVMQDEMISLEKDNRKKEKELLETKKELSEQRKEIDELKSMLQKLVKNKKR